jgi:hypothetical protein
MVPRRLWNYLAAAALVAGLAGSVFADGTGLLEDGQSQNDLASTRMFYQATRRRIEPSRLPLAVARAAGQAVPGLKVVEAYVIQHRPLTWVRMHTEFLVKGHDADGREVSVRTAEDGSQPMVTRVIALAIVPDAVLTEAWPYAVKHGYRLTRAVLVVRNERFLGRTSEHKTYYLKGSHQDRPGVETLVWLGGNGRFRLRDLDDLHLRLMMLAD